MMELKLSIKRGLVAICLVTAFVLPSYAEFERYKSEEYAEEKRHKDIKRAADVSRAVHAQNKNEKTMKNAVGELADISKAFHKKPLIGSNGILVEQQTQIKKMGDVAAKLNEFLITSKVGSPNPKDWIYRTELENKIKEFKARDGEFTKLSTEFDKEQQKTDAVIAKISRAANSSNEDIVKKVVNLLGRGADDLHPQSKLYSFSSKNAEKIGKFLTKHLKERDKNEERFQEGLKTFLEKIEAFKSNRNEASRKALSDARNQLVDVARLIIADNQKILDLSWSFRAYIENQKRVPHKDITQFVKANIDEIARRLAIAKHNDQNIAAVGGAHPLIDYASFLLANAPTAPNFPVAGQQQANAGVTTTTTQQNQGWNAGQGVQQGAVPQQNQGWTSTTQTGTTSLPPFGGNPVPPFGGIAGQGAQQGAVTQHLESAGVVRRPNAQQDDQYSGFPSEQYASASNQPETGRSSSRHEDFSHLRANDLIPPAVQQHYHVPPAQEDADDDDRD